MNNSNLIPYIPLFILIASFIFFVRNFEKKNPINNYAIHKEGKSPYGIGGFLSVIIWFKVGIVPLAIVGQLSSQFIMFEEHSPKIAASSDWNDFKAYYITTLVLVQVANWWAAYNLTNRFEPKSAKYAKILFLITPYFSVVYFFIGKSTLGFSPFDLLIEFSSSFIWSVILFSYFYFSKRIKNTYYSNEEIKVKTSENEKLVLTESVSQIQNVAPSNDDVAEYKEVANENLFPLNTPESKTELNLSGSLMRGKFIFIGLSFLILLLLAFFVWPTIWRYDQLAVNGNIFPVRMNRFSKHTEILKMGGWDNVDDEDAKVEDFVALGNTELAKLDGNLSVNLGTLSVDIYNGTNRPIRKIQIQVELVNKDGSAVFNRTYEL